MTNLATPRLAMQPLTLAQLQAWLRGQQEISARLGLHIEVGVVDEIVLRAMSAKVRKMQQAAPTSWSWYTYWLMRLQADPVAIGLAGFKGAPNEQGEVELGYSTAPAYQRQGFATEAVQALLAWAWAQPECRAVRAITLNSNLASQRVLQKTGLVIDQMREDVLIWRIWRP
jgi:[ribosomal protein S5]-alanine N-acetyltransferase